MNNSFVLGVSTLVGTIIGAGIFGLPYVISKSGIIPGIFYFVAVGIFVALSHLFLGEISLRTSEKHRIIGYAHKYLGIKGRVVATVASFFALSGALLAYIILAGDFLSILFSSFLPWPPAVFSILFWLVCSLLVLQGIQFIAKLGMFINIGLAGAFALAFFLIAPHIRAENFSLFHFPYMFLPYGVVFFTLVGWEAIPEIADLFKTSKDSRRFFRVIVWGSVIATLLSLAFTLFIIGATGSNTSHNALSGLVPLLGKNVAAFGALFGFFIIADSFLVLGNYLKNTLRYDFKIPTKLSAFIALGVPIALFLFGFREFISVIGTVGAALGAAQGVLIILIFYKAKIKGDRKPEYSISVPTFFLFIMAFILLSVAVAALLF